MSGKKKLKVRRITEAEYERYILSLQDASSPETGADGGGEKKRE